MKIETGMTLRTLRTTWRVVDVLEYADVVNPARKIRMALLEATWEGKPVVSSMSEDKINTLINLGALVAETP